MNLRAFTVLSVAAAALTTLATAAPAPASPTAPTFPAAELMTIGTFYYPEAWPAEQWPRDFANIRKLGLEFVHMGEFAWAAMEPSEGKFDFGWLDRALQLAADQGLKVILCTPTATPPIWLTEAHPEVLMIDANGRRMTHGTRQHATWSSDVYRQYAERIVAELGRRYGRDRRVWGWQLDNELSHYGQSLDFSAASVRKFQAWLQRKYVTIDALNQAWGTSFWSQVYARFDQIRLPNKLEAVAQLNPHQQLDAQRWYADEAADYLRLQAGILRRHCDRAQWITTNYMHNYSPIDPALNGQDLDVMSWTLYPVAGQANLGPLGFRLGDPHVMSFAADFMRSINGQAGIMELQPGQVNWAEVNPQPYPGTIRMWLMRIFASGSKFACTYRYRQVRFGSELYHDGLVGPDGVTPSSGGEQFAQTMRDIAGLRQVATPGAPLPPDYAARRTALLYDQDNRWNIDNHKQHKAWDTYEHLLKYYAGLKGAGAPVDIVRASREWETYPFVVAPAYQLVDPALVARWRRYVEHGGHLILSCRTGQKDRHGQLWEGPWAAPILDLIGADVKFYDCLPGTNVGQVRAGETTHAWNTWGEILLPRAGTQTLATYADHFYAGTVAAVTRRLGRGTVTYIGVDSIDGTLERQIIHDTLGAAGAKPAQYAPGFLVDWRDGLWIATNFNATPQPLPAGAQAKILIGGGTVPVAGVAVWQE